MNVANNIERRRSVSELSWENARLKVLNDFAIRMIAVTTEQDLAWHAVREVVGPLGFEDCVIYYHDPVQNVLHQVAALGPKSPKGNEIINPLVIPVGKGITGAVAQTRQSVIINDIQNDPRYIEDLEIAGSEICVPIIYGGTLLGVIDSESRETGHYTTGDQGVLEATAALMGAKLGVIHQERHLRQSERRFRSFFKLPQIGAAMRDVASGRWISASDAFCRMIGYTREELSPLSWLDLTHPDDRVQDTRLFQDAATSIREDAYTTVKRFVRKDGQLIFVEINGQCVRRENGQPEFNIYSVQDISARKKAESDLRNSEAEIRAILESLQDTFYRADVEGNLLIVSPAVKELLGYTPDELIGTRLATLYCHPPDRESLLAQLHLNEGKVKNFRTALAHKDGSTVQISSNCHYWIKDGCVVGVEGTVREII